MKKPLSGFQRQIHLDFHTSPFIPDVASDFDADTFAQTFADAHVNSVTLFAKCHHGMCYYPTQIGTPHPALYGRDLLGEQLKALHRRGIRTPIYTTIVWEEDAAQKHPQWRQLRKDGTFAGTSVATDNSGPHPGAWKWMNFLHPDYQDYFEAHIREIATRYGDAIDGWFFDILMMHRDADWSESGLNFREAHGLMSDDGETWARFQSRAQSEFARKFSGIVSGLTPGASIFYNSAHHFYTDSSVGAHERLTFNTHVEIESLPSGFWGYGHFPRTARLVDTWNVPWLSMTGRFQRQWGDFGGLKPVPALEFECFRAQALGGANSVGDQLPPRGVLDAGAYKLIGEVFAEHKAAEAFYAGSQPCWTTAILSPTWPGDGEAQGAQSEEGAVSECEGLHLDAAMLDDSADLLPFSTLILPDSVVITPAWKDKLRQFWTRGGKLLLSHRSGFDAQGEWALDFLPLRFAGEAAKWPTFWRTHEAFEPELALSDRVFYARGLSVLAPQEGVEVLAERVLPYFQRTDVTFCSHFQTPPQKEADAHPAIVAGDRWVYFADPIFREIRQTGNLAARRAFGAAMERLSGAVPFGADLPPSVTVYPRRKGGDLLLTLLRYVPVRKSQDIDIIDERGSFAGLTLSMPSSVESVRVWKGDELAREENGAFVLPASEGRLLLEVAGYFG